jgi:hypothetical protein
MKLDDDVFLKEFETFASRDRLKDYFANCTLHGPYVPFLGVCTSSAMIQFLESKLKELCIPINAYYLNHARYLETYKYKRSVLYRKYNKIEYKDLVDEVDFYDNKIKSIINYIRQFFIMPVLLDCQKTHVPYFHLQLNPDDYYKEGIKMIMISQVYNIMPLLYSKDIIDYCLDTFCETTNFSNSFYISQEQFYESLKKNCEILKDVKDYVRNYIVHYRKNHYYEKLEAIKELRTNGKMRIFPRIKPIKFSKWSKTIERKKAKGIL